MYNVLKVTYMNYTYNNNNKMYVCYMIQIKIILHVYLCEYTNIDRHSAKQKFEHF